jgi:hypothetical protein
MADYSAALRLGAVTSLLRPASDDDISISTLFAWPPHFPPFSLARRVSTVSDFLILAHRAFPLGEPAQIAGCPHLAHVMVV